MKCIPNAKKSDQNPLLCLAVHICKKYCFLSFLFTGLSLITNAQLLPGFKSTGIFNEQELTIKDQRNNVLININAPSQFNRKEKTYLIFYALPNGNSIEWTKGKKIQPGDDWHFDIQHISAQTRFVRNLDKKTIIS